MQSERRIKAYNDYNNTVSALRLLSFTLLFALEVQSNSTCFWSQCILQENIENAVNSCVASNNVVNKSEVCFVENKNRKLELGEKHFCCLEENSRSKRGSIFSNLAIVYGLAKEVTNEDFWWPDNEGAWQNVSLNCPFPPNISESFDQHPAKFFLYTKNNTNESDFDILSQDEGTLHRSGFIKGAPVKIITHGFLSNGKTGPTMYLRQFYNKLPYATNIISVQWEHLAALTNLKIPCYNLAAQLTRLVGKQTSQFMKFLIQQNVTTIKDIHVMGHSLGAHCSAFNCKEFSKYSMGKCSRLTGFDPAGPSFTNLTGADRIDYSDADFVDIIHTAATDLNIINGEIGSNIELGILEPVGHADFYPNQGGHQPGCEVLHYPLSSPACSHMRSYELYAESILPPNTFQGALCDTLQQAVKGECKGPSKSLMGEYTSIDNSSRRIYSLKTKGSPPYIWDNNPTLFEASLKFLGKYLPKMF